MTTLIKGTAQRVSNYYTTKELKKISNKITALYPEQIEELRVELAEIFKTFTVEQLVNINIDIDKRLK